MPGIVTGMLVALALAIGETAPLLYTAVVEFAADRTPPTSPVGYLIPPLSDEFGNQPSKSSICPMTRLSLLVGKFLLLLDLHNGNWLSRKCWDV